MPRCMHAVTVVLLAGSMLAGCSTVDSARAGTPAERRSISPHVTTSSGSASVSPATGPTTDPGATGPNPARTSSGPAGPASGPGPAGDASTGVSGLTVLSGACPAARAEAPCADKPVTARLALFDPAQHLVATVDSGTDGRFTLAIAPGHYVLRGVQVAGNAPRRPWSMDLTVAARQVTAVTVRFDAGIR